MRLLLIRLRLIGDVVFTTPLVRALRRELPDAHLAYLVEPAAAPVVQHNPCLDDVIVAPRTRGWPRVRDDLQLGLRVRRARYDVVLDLHGGPRASWLTRVSGARRRIGYDVTARRWVYTDVVDRPRELRPRHSVENQWDTLAPLLPDLPAPTPARDAVEMAPVPSAEAAIETWLRSEGLTPNHTLILIHVSAGNRFRRWPLDGFVDLSHRLAAADRNRRIILTSGPSEAEAARAVAREAHVRQPGWPESVRTCGDTSLDELRSLIGRAHVYIGGDSGPLHVAATTRTPIVGLYGPTLAARSAPWRDPRLFTVSVDAGELPCRPCAQRVCQPGDFRCLTRITVDAVLAAAERALSSAPASRPGPAERMSSTT